LAPSIEITLHQVKVEILDLKVSFNFSFHPRLALPILSLARSRLTFPPLT
jgi:hypothetical protein